MMTSRMQITFLALLAVLSSQLHASDACRCPSPVHYQTQFCRSDWVAKVTVKKSVLAANARRFTVDVDTIYKLRTPSAKEAFEKGPVEIFSPMHRCGMAALTTGARYILAGIMDSSKPKIKPCSEIIDSTAMSPQLEKNLKDEFQKGCNCGIVVEHPQTTDKTRCVWNYSDPGQCQRNFGACVKTGDACAWQSSPDYDNCMKKQTK